MNNHLVLDGSGMVSYAPEPPEEIVCERYDVEAYNEELCDFFYVNSSCYEDIAFEIAKELASNMETKTRVVIADDRLLSFGEIIETFG